MLPKMFQQQNKERRNEMISSLGLYTITYDYDLHPLYSEFIKESYEKWGNIVDNIGLMQLTGYNGEEIEFNFHQIMYNNYLLTEKLKSYSVIDIKKEDIINPQ